MDAKSAFLESILAFQRKFSVCAVNFSFKILLYDL